MTATVLRVTPREYRLVVERLLQYAGLDRQIVIPLRDTVMDAELATGSALRTIVEQPPSADLPALSLDGSVVDGAGLPALLIAPAVLDAVRRLGRIEVRNTLGPEHLAGLVITAVRDGLRLSVTPGADVTTVSVDGTLGDDGGGNRDDEYQRLAGGEERLAAMRDGIPLDAELWWTAYRRSNLALSVDTRVSRRHAGATIIDEDGTVRGAVDDEFDPAMFTGDREALFDESREKASADVSARNGEKSDRSRGTTT